MLGSLVGPHGLLSSPPCLPATHLVPPYPACDSLSAPVPCLLQLLVLLEGDPQGVQRGMKKKGENVAHIGGACTGLGLGSCSGLGVGVFS